jgi:hypothetical protein
MRGTLASTPRPVPNRTTPALAALLTLGVALVIFLVAGWDVRGWALGAVLWAATRGLSILVGRLRAERGGAATPGLHAFELAFKTLAVLVVLVALAASNPDLALSATLVFAIAYTVELGFSLASYYGSAK